MTGLRFLNWVRAAARQAFTAERGRALRHWNVPPAIVSAQVAEVSKQTRTATRIDIICALVVSWLFADHPNHVVLWLTCGALVLLALSGMFVLPGTPFCRDHYPAARHQRLALHGYSILLGLGWSGMLGVPLLGADEANRTYLLSSMVVATCAGGLVLAMLPLAATIFVTIMGLGILTSLYLSPLDVPLAIYLGVVVYISMLTRVFFDLANLFVGQLQSATDLAAIEEAKREEQRLEMERRAAERLQREHDRQAALAREQQAHRGNMLKLAQAFEASVFSVAHNLGDAVGQLQDSSSALQTIGRDTNNRACAASQRATSASAAVASVAEASGQMAQAVGHVSDRVAEQVRASATARASAAETRRALEELSISAHDIASVAVLIRDIAANTNLLALNATIEAARAGDAGRGFAVVAQEVKSLATQTGTAIGRIGATTEAIQTRVAGALAAVERTAVQVESVSDGAEAIAAAVTQQRQASSHIERNASDAAGDAADVHGNIAQLADRTRETDALTDSMRALASTLDDQSRGLSQAARDFLGRLRAA